MQAASCRTAALCKAELMQPDISKIYVVLFQRFLLLVFVFSLPRTKELFQAVRIYVFNFCL